MVTSLRLPEELERAVLAYAERHDVSKSRAMRVLMQRGLENEGDETSVPDLEDRVASMEATLSTLVGTLEEVQSSLDAETRATTRSGEDGSSTPTTVVADGSGSTAIATVPGGPDAQAERQTFGSE